MKIVNRRHHTVLDDNMVYVGRPAQGLRGSPLANPYKIGPHGDRENVIRLYRQWLAGQIKKRDRAVLDALRQLDENSVLLCWCAPKACHAEVVERAWRYCKQEGII